MQPEAALLVGGFARAQRLRRDALLPPPEAGALVAEAESEVIAHMNQDHPAAVQRIAQRLGGAGEGWRMQAVDQDGAELGNGETVLRLAFRQPATNIAALRQELVTASTVQHEGLL